MNMTAAHIAVDQIASVYGRPKNQIQNWASKGLLRYVDKRKASRSESMQVQFLGERQSLASGSSIITRDQIVKKYGTGGTLFEATEDKRYMDAVNSGDMETAQRIVDNVARRKGYVTDDDYRMDHQAPHSGNDLDKNVMQLAEPDSKLVPSDYWAHPEWYGIGDEVGGYESFEKISTMIGKIKAGKKDVGAWFYRAVPSDINEGSFRNGDWISPSRAYADEHGARQFGAGKYRVISQFVKAEDAWWNADSINEWGYDDGKGYAYRKTKNNRKLTDVITRDENGDIIPPSKRFNFRNDSILFQKSDEIKQKKISSAVPRMGVPENVDQEGFVYRLAEESNEEFHQTVEEMRKLVGSSMPALFRSELKKKERARKKVANNYGGDWGRLFDINGATITTETFDEARAAYNAIIASGKYDIVKKKEKSTAFGYRDFSLNFKLSNGFIGELQIIEVWTLRNKNENGGHKIYDVARELEPFIDEKKSPFLHTKIFDLVKNLYYEMPVWSSGVYEKNLQYDNPGFNANFLAISSLITPLSMQLRWNMERSYGVGSLSMTDLPSSEESSTVITPSSILNGISQISKYMGLLQSTMSASYNPNLHQIPGNGNGGTSFQLSTEQQESSRSQDGSDGIMFEGYDWERRMSRNAVSAYEEGLAPLHKWTKAAISSVISAGASQEIADVLTKGLPTTTLHDLFLRYSEWHHGGTTGVLRIRRAGRRHAGLSERQGRRERQGRIPSQESEWRREDDRLQEGHRRTEEGAFPISGPSGAFSEAGRRRIQQACEDRGAERSKLRRRTYRKGPHRK